MNAKERWVVEVRASSTETDDGNEWIRIAECDNSTAAIAIGDALHNLMQTGLVRYRTFQIQTRMAAA